MSRKRPMTSKWSAMRSAPRSRLEFIRGARDLGRSNAYAAIGNTIAGITPRRPHRLAGVRDTMGAATRGELPSLLQKQPMELAMKCNDLSRSLVAFDQNSTLVAVVELSLNSWVAA